MRTIAIVNQKGGCGKTTTAINLAAVLARRGYRTLLVDMDPQSHCAAGLGIPEDRIECHIGDALLARHDESYDPMRSHASPLLWEIAPGFDLAPSTMMLSALEAPGGGLHELPDRDRRLAGLLERLGDRYDLCLVDCPPTIGLLTFSALRAAREAIIPVETGFFAMRGAHRQWETIQTVIRRIDQPITCHLVATLHDRGSHLSRNILMSLQRRFVGNLLPIVIHEHEVLREAASLGQPVVSCAPGSEASSDYTALADWLLSHPVTDSAPGAKHEAEHAPSGGGGRAAELARRIHEMSRRPVAPPPWCKPLGARPPHARAAAPPPWCKPLGARPPASRPRSTAETKPPIQSLIRSAEPRRFGVTETRDGVRFVQPGTPDQMLMIVGDFNDWMAESLPMRYDPVAGVFEALIQLAPGRYRYRIVVDGRPQADSYNTARDLLDADPVGRASVLELEPLGVAT